MKELLTPQALLTNLKDVRALTRKVIEAFPEKDLFESYGLSFQRKISGATHAFLRRRLSYYQSGSIGFVGQSY